MLARIMAYLIGCACGQLANAQLPPPADSVRRELEAMYMIQDEAIKKKDFDAFVSTFAPDYSVKLLNGDTLNREQIEGYIKSDMARTTRVEKSVSSIDSLLVTHDTATVIVTHEANRVLEDAHGQPHTWENVVIHKETWIKTSAGWKIRRLEEVKQVSVLRDGTPFHG